MRIPIVYDDIIECCAQTDENEKVEIESVSAALSRLGYQPFELPVSGSVDQASFRELRALLVFNCVDTLEETARLAHVVPSLLDEIEIPYTGASTDAIYLTSHKLIAKRLLRAHGIRTPRWCQVERAITRGLPFQPPLIVKHIWEDGSHGLDRHSVLCQEADVDTSLSNMPVEQRCDWFLEAFVNGREFNVSVIAENGKPRVLPPLELLFCGFENDRPRIVDQETKWGHDVGRGPRLSRRFDFVAEDGALLLELAETARKCWELFGLKGYARVDFRVDHEGRPWVLEINVNPYLGADSSFVAAAAREGLGFDDVIRRVVDDALCRNR